MRLRIIGCLIVSGLLTGCFTSVEITEISVTPATAPPGEKVLICAEGKGDFEYFVRDEGNETWTYLPEYGKCREYATQAPSFEYKVEAERP